MGSTKFTVLDIGHGNCSLIESSENFTVIDAAQGSTLLDILESKNIAFIDDLIISHADSDHIGGAIAVLLNDSINVKNVHLNPDGIKKTKVWDDFRAAVKFSREKYATRVHTSINRDTDDIIYNDYKLEVLSPCPIDCLSGPGTTSINNSRLDANSMSVVLRLIHNGEKIALIPGDMDASTLNYLIHEKQCLNAKILVFPHHGGRPGNGNPLEFSRELCTKVNPELVLFSNSRFKHNNPIPDVISGIKHSNCGAHLACTQMSESCCNNPLHLSNSHLMPNYPSTGHEKKHSCAGSITITLKGQNTDVASTLAPHKAYITSFSTRKCI